MAGLDISNKPWWVGLVIGLVIGVVSIWAMEQYVIKPVQNDIAKATVELNKLKEKVREGKAAEARLPQFREEAQRLETELQRLLKILPTARQTDELIKKVKSLTERGAFRLVTFQPQGFAKKDFITEWPINVALQASYHELALFFDRLSRFSRIINVESLTINASPGKTRTYTINTNFVMKTFIYGSVKEGAGT
jgi:type IV pilus assembly protein PilO